MGKIIDKAFEYGLSYKGEMQAPSYDDRQDKIMTKGNVESLCRAWWRGRIAAGVPAPEWYYHGVKEG